ncbi:MAG: N-acetylmuramoyl-L-alanine amidase [Chlamydiae bacterium]|nr:N-acetylmuramoyl-L-alanine amidase [Chlamydiota bacterium]
MVRLFFFLLVLFPQVSYAARLKKHPVVKPSMKVEITKTKIIVDPGHGGDDFGTKVGTVIEKIVNLKTSEYVAALLKKSGYEVQMTRKKDIFVPLADRVEMANRSKASLMVSIHFNAAQSKEAEGLEIFYYKDPVLERKTLSKNLADAVMKKILDKTKAKSRGVKSGNFCVIRDTTIPAILVEGGFLTNERELEKIRQDQYLKSLAQGIVDGIEAYLKVGLK